MPCVRACLVALSCPTLCRFTDCSLPGSSVHGISQARILEWVAIPSSRGSSQLRDWTWVSCIADRFFYCMSRQGSPPCSQRIKLECMDMNEEGTEGTKWRESPHELGTQWLFRGRTRSYINSAAWQTPKWDPTPRKFNLKVFGLPKKLSPRIFVARAHGQGQFLLPGYIEIWEVYTLFLFATCPSRWSLHFGSTWTKTSRYPKVSVSAVSGTGTPPPSQAFIMRSALAR